MKLRLNSLKKITVYVFTFFLVLITVQTALAKGAYMGVLGGYESMNVDKDIKIIPPSPFVPFTFDFDNQMHGMVGGLTFGYDNAWGRFYLAGELRATIQTTDGTQETVDSLGKHGVDEEFDRTVSLSIIPGISPYKRILLFGRLGVVWGEFESSVIGLDSGSFGFPTDFDKSVVGAIFGIGFGIYFNPHVSLSFEYDHSMFPQFDKKAASVPQFNPQNTGDYDYKLSENSLLINLVFHFTEESHMLANGFNLNTQSFE